MTDAVINRPPRQPNPPGREMLGWVARGEVGLALGVVLIVVLLIALTRNRLPWRYVPGTDERFSGEDPDPVPAASPATEPPAPRRTPDAYADSP